MSRRAWTVVWGILLVLGIVIIVALLVVMHKFDVDGPMKYILIGLVSSLWGNVLVQFIRSLVKLIRKGPRKQAANIHPTV